MKDPAVLWYFNDWHGGTITLSRHQKGCYIDLLYAQFNSGHLSLEEIKTVLGSDFGQTWPTLQKKFVKDESTGLYYNERLVFEAEKRKSFSKSRRDNLKGEKKEIASHMVAHMEIENIISFLPSSYNKTEFNILLEKWAKNRKKKPNADLIELRVRELVAKYPLWADAKKAMTEAAAEGWLKFVYPDKYQPEKQKQEGSFAKENAVHTDRP